MTERMIDVTMPIGLSVSARQCRRAALVRDAWLDRRRIVSEIESLSPHAVTHVDLPWTVNWKRWLDEWQLFSQMKDDDPARPAYERALTPFGGATPTPPLLDTDDYDESTKASRLLRTMFLEYRNEPVLLLNFSHLATRFRRLLQELSDEGQLKARNLISPNYPAEKFVELLESLWIRPQDLIDAIGSNDPTGKVIFLYTSWNSSMRPTVQDQDLSNPCFEGWHAYLLHPFLDLQSVKLLNELEIVGTASDTYGIECPVYYAQRRGTWEYVGEVQKQMEESGQIGNIVCPPSWQPVHIELLRRSLFMLENARLVGNPFRTGTGSNSLGALRSERCIEGRLHVHPLVFNQPEYQVCGDSVVVKTYLEVK